MADILKCIVCQEWYDIRNRTPVALPACGHTFCRSCLLAIQSKSSGIKCPTCRCLHVGRPVEDLAINYSLMNLIKDEGDKGSESTESKDTRESNNNKEFVGSSPHPSKEESEGSNKPGNNGGPAKKILIGTCAAVGAVGVVAATPFVLAGVGFTSGGIAAGSMAASMMSSAAAAGGGGVAAGGIVATLQSIGAAGLGATGTAVMGSVGSAVGGGVGFLSSKLFGRKTGESDEDANSGAGKDKNKTKKHEKDGNIDKDDSSEDESDKDDSKDKCDKDDSKDEFDKDDSSEDESDKDDSKDQNDKDDGEDE